MKTPSPLQNMNFKDLFSLIKELEIASKNADKVNIGNHEFKDVEKLVVQRRCINQLINFIAEYKSDFKEVKE